MEPVTIQLPVSLGNRLVNVPQPSECRVRVFFRSAERGTKEWVEISDKLEIPASYDGKLVKFKVQRFSGYVYIICALAYKFHAHLVMFYHFFSFLAFLCDLFLPCIYVAFLT